MSPSGYWAPVYQSLWTHRKTFELAALLGINETYAGAHLVRLWTWAIDNAPDGDVADLSDRAIAYGAGWSQEVSLFVGALIKAGFLDADRRLHDWDDYAGKLIERREKDAARKQKSRGPAPDVRGTSNGVSGVVRRRREESREEEKRVEENHHPLPPPQAEGGEMPITAEDCQLWKRALAALPQMTDGNREQVNSLEPIGRAGDGGLRLRAPPGHRLARFRPQIARALADAGDAHGTHVQIVER
jgi:hypothetical protein